MKISFVSWTRLLFVSWDVLGDARSAAVQEGYWVVLSAQKIIEARDYIEIIHKGLGVGYAWPLCSWFKSSPGW